MKKLLLLTALLISCSGPKPPKVYTEVEIGMPLHEFQRLCDIGSTDSQTHTNANSETRVIFNKSTDYKGDERPAMCVGTFTFINHKLDSITR